MKLTVKATENGWLEYLCVCVLKNFNGSSARVPGPERSVEGSPFRSLSSDVGPEIDGKGSTRWALNRDVGLEMVKK